MADTLDGLKSRGNINTTAAETVELDTSREDVRVLLKSIINRVGESTLEGKSAVDFGVALVLVGLASSIVAAITLAVLSRARLHAVGITVARFVAGGANLDTKELVAGHGLLRDLGDHTINLEADLALSLEVTEVGFSGLKLVVETSKLIGDEVLRDSSLITSEVHLTLVGGLHVSVLHETKEGVSLEAEVTILARNGGRGSLGIVVGILEDGAEVSVKTLLVEGRDPTMRPAGSDIGTELGILKASIRGSISRSRGGNVDVVRKLLLVEHGARIAGRHEEDKLLEHLLAPAWR